ncbi:MAG TPA: Rieske 2Fe-2S domain-containing protein [Chloroflexota bacterium]|jgi:phthalate 4,5-dioxygenase oxygenase subunit|nr:Rieske 2Fe-2S domain-containing protein [Chloroflexota bacterium]
MLTREENELLCHVGAETPMGQMLRRYWMPALQSNDLRAGGAPRRVRLLGEDLVAFRDDNGQVGVLDEYCPHRGASLVLARNDDCALTCIYHGWRIDAQGNVLETPAEPEESDFVNRVKTISYPVREAGGLIWTYMGPAQLEPPFPAFGWTMASDDQRLIVQMREECNWVQCLEGVIDSAHSSFLHSMEIQPSAEQSASGGSSKLQQGTTTVVHRPSNDKRPRLEAQNTDYGFRYVAIRKPIQDPDKYAYIRMTLFVAPFYAFFPPPQGWTYMQAFVPIDDHHTMFFYIQVDKSGPIANRDSLFAFAGARMGTDIDTEYRKLRTRANNFLQDREAMKRNQSYSGIFGVNVQDIAVQESMGPIYDRTREHLGASDVAVIRMRRLMLDSVQRFQEGGAPLGLEQPVAYETLAADERLIPLHTPWQSIGSADPASVI